MKRLLIIIVGFMMCAWMTSCMTTQWVKVSDEEISEIWQGQTKKDIICKFGPPTRETSDGDDGSIIIYEYNLGSSSTTTTRYNEYTNTKNEITNTNYATEYVWFFLNSEDICVGAKNNHLIKEEQTKLSAGTMTLSVLTAILLGIGLSAAIVYGL